MLKVENLHKKYIQRNTGEIKSVLNGVNLIVEPGAVTWLEGDSGSGKSTMIKILLRLLPYDDGKICYTFGDGRTVDYRNFSRNDNKLFRREVQYISQQPESFFDPSVIMEKSLLEVFAIHRELDGGRASNMSSIGDILQTVRLTPKHLERFPHQLSGGELQRLALCRALLVQPRLLILDEPVSMLDEKNARLLMDILYTLNETQQMSILLSSHDVDKIKGWKFRKSLAIQ